MNDWNEAGDGFDWSTTEVAQVRTLHKILKPIPDEILARMWSDFSQNKAAGWLTPNGYCNDFLEFLRDPAGQQMCYFDPKESVPLWQGWEKKIFSTSSSLPR